MTQRSAAVNREDPLRLPAALTTPDDAAARKLLSRYYARPLDDEQGYTGSAFDFWGSPGAYAESADVFTADDVLAVSLLSVQLNGRAAHELLVRRRDEFSALLTAVGPDRDLVDVEEDIADDWPAFVLYARLKTLPGVGPTKASKLVARKRPRLYPVWDTVVASHLGDPSEYTRPLRRALRAGDRALHHRLVRLGQAAGLPAVSPLRIFDVIAWLEATGAEPSATADDEVEAPTGEAAP